MAAIYQEENGLYSLDCTNAVWSTDRIHQDYQDPTHTLGQIGFLKDVDFVIETEDSMLLVEYKNANIPGAVNPQKFNPGANNRLDQVAEKYYDSLHWLSLTNKKKPLKYVFILEYPAGNSTSRLFVRNELQKRLPFALQKALSAGGKQLISEVKVVDIAEWNADPELGKFPLRPVASGIS